MDRPIFVFGCCNSGTTILWQALMQHGGVSGPDAEAQDIEDLPPSMRHHLGKATFRLWAHPKFKLCYYSTEEDYSESDEESIREIYVRYHTPGTRFIAKSPADTLRARLIQAYFPDAYFIAIVRNGYAVSEGIVRKRRFDPERPEFAGLYTSIDEAAEQWFRANTIIVSHQTFLRHYLIVKYEDLIMYPQKVLHSVLDFCGLETDGFRIPSFNQTLNEEQIARLSDYDLETVTRIAGPMLRHFGYDLINRQLNWTSPEEEEIQQSSLP